MPLIIAVITFNLALLLATVTWRRIFPEVEVVVAKADLAAGVAITADQLTRVTVPGASRPPDAVTLENAVGKWTAIPLLKGEPVTQRRLQATAPAQGDKIKSGLLSIPVNGQYALGGRLRPGDTVTFMIVARTEPQRTTTTAAREAPQSQPQPGGQATILLRDIPVIDVRTSNGQSAAPAEPNTKAAAGPLGMPAAAENSLPAMVLVDVTESQALQLADAVESKAAIYLYRRSADEVSHAQ